jgi:hypothetical protein
MYESPVIVGMEITEFQRWLKQGIIDVSPDILVELPVVVDSMADLTHARFYICLPAKYGSILLKKHTILALIDECEVISLDTLPLTLEWRVRMKNLGETWLPFSFQADWFEYQKARPINQTEPLTEVGIKPDEPDIVETWERTFIPPANQTGKSTRRKSPRKSMTNKEKHDS